MKYGIIGDSLNHSFTKELHEKISHSDYQEVVLTEKELKDFFKKRDFNGLIVTSTYKEKVIPYIDVVDEHAKELGSCGVIVNRGGRLFGYNTDFEGICGLIVNSGIIVRDKKVLILGDGALGKTAHAVCESLGVNKIYQISQKKQGAFTYDEYKDYTDAEVIINATFIGRYPNVLEKPVDLTRFKALEGVIDTVYNPIRTALTIDALNLGIPSVSGLFMLVRRTIVAEELFTGDKLKYSLNEQVYNELLREKENIVLVGMSGSGKSAIGSLIADITKREFVDVNDLISEKYGSPASLVKTKGEEALRRAEEDIIASISMKTACVIATSEGAVLRAKNIYALKSNGKIVFIDRSVALIENAEFSAYGSMNASVSSVYASRYPEYKKAADIVVDGDNSIRDVADSVLNRFKRGISTGMPHVLVVGGPNVNLLGVMAPDIYGTLPYTDLCEKIHKYGETKGVKIEIFQSNHEGNIIDKLQESMGIVDGIVINPSSFAHTSIAIGDTIRAIGIPTVEIHISKVDEREEYRKVDYIKDSCFQTITGKGTDGYFEAIDKLCAKFG